VAELLRAWIKLDMVRLKPGATGEPEASVGSVRLPASASHVQKASARPSRSAASEGW
jgi:hypothetical protein